MRGDFFQVYLPGILVVVAAFVIAFQFVAPPPPDHFRIASGSQAGAYNLVAREYAAALAEQGITLEVLETSGSVENLDLLQSGAADVAFVQGGVGVPAALPDLVGLASLYYEPLWIFARNGEETLGHGSLESRTLAIGGAGSGTQALVRELLQATGLQDSVTLSEIGGVAAAEALRAGEVDYAFFVAGTRSPVVRELLQDQEIALVDLQRTEAYARQFRHLSPLLLPEGALDLARNLPRRDVRLIAPAATLVASDDLHPALVGLLLEAATGIHETGDVLAAPGTFPSGTLVEFPLSDDAKRFLKRGPSFFQRYLPFWIATSIDRLWVLAIPLLTILFPLLRIAPPVYRWRVRRKIYRWYRDLRRIEEGLREAGDETVRGALLADLERLQADVGRIETPLAHTEHLYHLRSHIEFVKDLFARGV